METYHTLQSKFAEFQECLGNTLQGLGDRVDEQETRERQLEARSQALETRENDRTRLQELERENGCLKKEIEKLRLDLTRVDEDADAKIQELREDHEDLHPRRVLLPRRTTSRRVPQKVYAHHYHPLADRYTELYQDKSVLIDSYSVLTKKLKSCKEKVKQWERCFERDTITTVANGRTVVFKRVDDSGTTQEPARQVQKREPESPTLPRMPNTSRRRPGTPTIPANQASSNDEPSSTQSQDPRWPVNEPTQSLPSSSDTPTISAVRPVRSDGRGSNRVAANDTATSGRETGSFTRAVTVKSEQSSSSAIQVPNWTNNSNGDMEHRDEHPDQGLDAHVEAPVARPPVFEDRQQSNQETVSHGQRGANSERTPRGTKRRALQPLDNNCITPQASEQRAKRKKDESRGAAAISSVAEDGDENGLPTERRSTPATHGRNTGVPPDSRLQRLLGEPAGPRPVLTPSPAARHGSASRESPVRTATPNTVSKSSSRFAPTSHSKRKARPSAEGYERYRSRPVDRLGLDHFKVNPERNQGLDFPFQEVVRNKDQRKCLSGCVRQDCCGPIFRSMAIEGRPGRPPITDTLSLSSLNHEDRQLLETYLGNSTSGMSNAELRSTLIEARAQELADLYGKHRHAHDRSGTPPGFWRTDMPDTQEQQHDRQLAKEMERVKVMDRYREAMKPGGKWMFADE